MKEYIEVAIKNGEVQFLSGNSLYQQNFISGIVYLTIAHITTKMLKYTELTYEQVLLHIKNEVILLVTATDTETVATHNKIKPLDSFDNIIRVFEGDLTYYFGIFGNYGIAHVQCAMGSLSRESSIMTIATAIDRLKCKVVIMVGIAFGVDEQKQQIGDVLISESIIPYNTRRIGKDETIQRGIEAPSSKILLNRFRNIKTTWEHILPGDKIAKLIPTRLLSGEELIDNCGYRNNLIKDNPDSKGGEMEGAGVYAACDGKADWIVIKGICDFADGEKGQDKETKQNIAINSALSACLEIFNSNSAFKELNVFPYSDGADENKMEANVNDVLFDLYDSSKEKYYLHRTQDSEFISTLSVFGVWIYGPTGCGKSNLIIRNLIKNRLEFIQISLAGCIGMSTDSYFSEILSEIYEKVDGKRNHADPQNFSECSRILISLLERKYKNKELVIFIEEIPIAGEKEYREFSNRIFSLISSKNLIVGLDKVKFVLSTINNPVEFILIFQQKVHQHIKFVELKYWDEVDVLRLIGIIEKEVGFSLPDGIKMELVTTAIGSPRFIKRFFRNVFSLNKKDHDTLKLILKGTERDLLHHGNN